MRLEAGLICLILAAPGMAAAQTDWRVTQSRPLDFSSILPDSITLAPQNEARFEGAGFSDRLRITPRDDGWMQTPSQPWAVNTDARENRYDLSYRRDWVAASGQTASGLEVSLTPHAGLGTEEGAPSAEAGATLRIGQGLDRLAPDGDEVFGEKPRWYLYAAGSKKAVGYNFTRTRDGDLSRSGVSHDSGAFMGDASVGLAYRRGALHTSVGLAYREIETKGLRSYDGIRTDVSEGLIAFQLTIRP